MKGKEFGLVTHFWHDVPHLPDVIGTERVADRAIGSNKTSK